MASVLGISPYGPSIVDTAIKSGKGVSDLISQYYQTKQRRAAAQRAEQLFPYQLEDARLATTKTQQMQPSEIETMLQKLQLERQYAGREKETGYQQQLAKLGVTQAQRPEIEAKTGLTQEKTKYFPLETLIKAQAAVDASKEQKRLTGRFGPGYALRNYWRELSPTTRYTQQALHPEAVATIGSQLVQRVLNPEQQAGTATPNYLTPEVMAKFGFAPPEQPAIIENIGAPPQTPISPEMQGGALDVGGEMGDLGRKMLTPPGMQPQEGGAPLPQEEVVPEPPAPGTPGSKLAWEITPEDVENEKRASALAANQTVTTMSSRKRNEYAESLEGLLNQPMAQTMLKMLAKYPGIANWTTVRTKAVLEPKEYASYTIANNGFMSLVGSSLKGMEGIQNTDMGTKAANGYLQEAKKLWSTNKAAARKNLFQALTLLEEESKAVHRTATPVMEVERRGRTPIKIPESFKPKSQQQRQPQTGAMTTMIAPDGKAYSIPQNQVSGALKNKWRRM